MRNGRTLGRAVTMWLALALAMAAAVGMVSGCTKETAAGSLVVKGSDTLVNLSAAWAEAFMEANEGVEISVQGGGSSTGFKALIDGMADLANASRPIKDSERQALEAKGKVPVAHVVACDAVNMVVHPSNPIRSLTMQQLSAILTGQVTNWKSLGGEDRPITVYSRETSSGTYAFVREHVMGDQDYVFSARLMPSSESILQAVSQDATAIGYVGLGYVTEAVRVLAVAVDDASPAVPPSIETVNDGSYPVARPLFVYSAGEPGDLGKAFIEFCTSEAGRAITEEMGFVPVGS